MVFIIIQGCFPSSNISIIRECECTNGTYGSYYGTSTRRLYSLFHTMFDCSPNLGWRSSNFASFAMSFDNDTIVVCFIHIIWPRSKMEIVFFSIGYQILLHDWDMNNYAFAFASSHEVRAYLRKLKEILMWQFNFLRTFKFFLWGVKENIL